MLRNSLPKPPHPCQADNPTGVGICPCLAGLSTVDRDIIFHGASSAHTEGAVTAVDSLAAEMWQGQDILRLPHLSLSPQV